MFPAIISAFKRTKSNMIKDEEQSKFDELVEIAEKYIAEKACAILNVIRGANVEKDENCCFNLIYDYYKPMYEINPSYGDANEYLKANEKSKYYEKTAITLKEKLLVRFCIQQQNYQAMPKAINYAFYIDGKTKTNKIFEIVKPYLGNHNIKYCNLYNKFLDELKFEQNKENDNFESELKVKVKVCKDEGSRKTKYLYNYAWLKYSEGLCSCIQYLNGMENGKLIHLIKRVNNNDDIPEKKLKNDFYKNIKHLGKTLSYDFFKEIGCRNLLKDDVHIVAIYKKVFNAETTNNDEIVKKMLGYCKKYEEKHKGKDPYYIDKILWLCCTGSFYEDNIILTSMSRRGFLEYYKENKKEKIK